MEEKLHCPRQSSLHGEDIVSWKEQFQPTSVTNQLFDTFGEVFFSPLSEKNVSGVLECWIRSGILNPGYTLEPSGELLKSYVWAPPQTN